MGTRRSSRTVAVAPIVESESEPEVVESDDSGSEFDPEDADSDFADDLDDDDEEVMVDAARLISMLILCHFSAST